MKPSVLILLLLAAACQSKPKDKLAIAKQVVVTKIKESAHDWKSYEAVKWGKLDSSFTTITDDSIYVAANKAAEEAIEEYKEANKLAEIWVGSYSSYGNNRLRQYLKEGKRYYAIAQANIDIMDSITKSFQRRFNGYTLSHSYRIKNTSGNLGIAHDLYYFDTTLSITHIKDMATNYYDKDDNKGGK